MTEKLGQLGEGAEKMKPDEFASDVAKESLERVAEKNTISAEKASEPGLLDKLTENMDELDDFESLALSFGALAVSAIGANLNFDSGFGGFFKSLFSGVDDGSTNFEFAEGTLENLSQKRKAIMKAADNVFKLGHEIFETPPPPSAIRGGRLGCAYTVTRILKDAGVIEEGSMSVARLGTKLKKDGWRSHQGPPQAGDVIVWKRQVKRQSNGSVELGHAHVGIYVGQRMREGEMQPTAISNSSSKQQCHYHDVGDEPGTWWYENLGVAEYLSPPV